MSKQDNTEQRRSSKHAPGGGVRGASAYQTTNGRQAVWAKRLAARPGGGSSTAVVRGSRGPRAVLKFHLCVRRVRCPRQGVIGCRNENFACE